MDSGAKESKKSCLESCSEKRRRRLDRAENGRAGNCRSTCTPTNVRLIDARREREERACDKRRKKALTAYARGNSYTGMLLAVGILYFGLQARPNTNIRDWARQEALKRSEETK